MTTVTNTTGGNKVVNSVPPAILTPGETMDLEISDAELEVMRGTGWFSFDGDDEKPVSLSGKKKAELLKIAEAEGVEIEEGATNDDIIAAIELHREG
ncbi:hypothetical protein [Sphingomonas sp.]|uniref:hypothetical protein n=1 Tax=Sphingomonas sp. TaxID=28214 RepID=UPI002FDB231E